MLPCVPQNRAACWRPICSAIQGRTLHKTSKQFTRVVKELHLNNFHMFIQLFQHNRKLIPWHTSKKGTYNKQKADLSTTKGYLKDCHPKEFYHFSSGCMSFKRTLHEAPVPKFVDNHRWPRIDMEKLQCKTSWKGCGESQVSWLCSFISWVIDPELLRQGGL